MGREARNRGTYEERKAAAIIRNQEEGIAERVEEKDIILNMTQGEIERRRQSYLILTMASMWMRGYGGGGLK